MASGGGRDGAGGHGLGGGAGSGAAALEPGPAAGAGAASWAGRQGRRSSHVSRNRRAPYMPIGRLDRAFYAAVMAAQARPRVAISLGDPSGIGPEVVARALAARPDLDVVIYGDGGVLERAAAAAGVAPPPAALVEAVTALGAGEVTPGRP